MRAFAIGIISLQVAGSLYVTGYVGAVVFMASASAIPELFTNLISTFIADSDMGLGAVMESLMWNVLGLAALEIFFTFLLQTTTKCGWKAFATGHILFELIFSVCFWRELF